MFIFKKVTYWCIVYFKKNYLNFSCYWN